MALPDLAMADETVPYRKYFLIKFNPIVISIQLCWVLLNGVKLSLLIFSRYYVSTHVQ